MDGEAATPVGGVSGAGGAAGTPGEMVEVIDDGGAVVGLATRAEMRDRNLRHRSVAVVVTTTGDAVVAHRRADWKDVWPGRWDVCFGGVVGAGESWRAAARRELAEEAGVHVPAGAFRPIGRGAFADDVVSTLTRVYHLTHDGPFHPADGEVAELVLVPRAALGAWSAGRALCPDTAALVVPLLVGVPPSGPAPAAE